MKSSAVFILVFFLTSCNYISNRKEDNSEKGRVVARVYSSLLYENELSVPSNLTGTDSVQLVKTIINSWARQQLLLHHAEINLEDKSKEFNKLVTDYHSALYINAYKESLVLDKLNLEVTDYEIEKYYTINQNNFKLNEELLQLRFIHADSGRNDKKELIKLFRSKSSSDIDSLQLRKLEFRSFNFNDSVWVKYTEVLQKIEGLNKLDKKRILKKSSFIQKEDSSGLYLILVKDVLRRNETAPLSYVSPTIKQIILQKRKLEFLREIEVDLLNDAIKNQYFEEY
ncbi:MAG: hypothetical protein KAH07_06900 [Flavobacteriaceae bacterium]|nr:hypothetical protein [Flavobacteriaceae bacterium]